MHLNDALYFDLLINLNIFWILFFTKQTLGVNTQMNQINVLDIKYTSFDFSFYIMATSTQYPREEINKI